MDKVAERTYMSKILLPIEPGNHPIYHIEPGILCEVPHEGYDLCRWSTLKEEIAKGGVYRPLGWIRIVIYAMNLKEILGWVVTRKSRILAWDFKVKLPQSNLLRDNLLRSRCIL
jgi:hypothetical protein